MATFPTTSVVLSTAKPDEYDLMQLSHAVASTDPLVEPQPIAPELFHLHTHTIQVTLQPEEPLIKYPDGRRENPAAAVFNDLVKTLREVTEECVPVVLALPMDNLLHQPFNVLKFKTKSAWRHGPHIALPSSVPEEPLLRLQGEIPSEGRPYLMNATAWDSCTWINAALALDPTYGPTRRTKYRDDHRRVVLRTGVQVVWVPDGTGDAAGTELRLLITVDAYLDMTLLDIPLPPIGADIFGLILTSLLPSDASSEEEGDSLTKRANALRDFYDSLSSAPALPVTLEPHIQPPGLRCRLLPFQQRTLALLLEREGAPIAGVTKPRAPTGQWSKFHFDGFGTYAFRRLTATLVKIDEDRKGKGRAKSPEAESAQMGSLPRLFDLGHVRGTMLCEEMGLGKTVEAIALMLLHRHPLSVPRSLATAAAVRSSPMVDLLNPPPDFDEPEIKAWIDNEHAAFKEAITWSDESQLNVAEVATTLVVTPQPLLKQWVTEMATHAPSLRVCVYPGWKVLIEQVEQRRKAHAKQSLARQKERLKRKNKQIRNQTRRKYAKGNKGQSVEIEFESEDDEEEEMNEALSAEDSLLVYTQTAWLDYVRGHDIVITTYQTLGQDLAVAHPAPKRSRRSTAKYNLEERPRSPLVMVEWWRVIMDEIQLQGASMSLAANMVSLIPRKCSLAMSGTPARNEARDLQGSLHFLRVPGIDNTIWNRLLHRDNREAFHGLFQALAVRTTKAEVRGEFVLPPQSRTIVPIELSDIEMHYYLDTLERQRDRLRVADRRQPGWSMDQAVFRVSLRHLRQICTHIQVGILQRAGGNPLDRVGRLNLGNALMTMDEALKKMRAENHQDILIQSRQQMRYLIRKAQLTVLNDEDDLRNMKALTILERVRASADKVLFPARAHLKELVGDREDSVDVDDDEPDKMASQAEKERTRQIMAARIVIRETLLIYHQGWFFEGDVRHVQGEEALEVLAYESALDIRKEILSRPMKIANRSVESLVKGLESNPVLSSLDDLQTSQTNWTSGILTAEIFDQANCLLKILNDNATLIFNWRQKVVELLQLPLETDANVPAAGQGQDVENPEEEDYAVLLKAQGDLEAYLTAYASSIADRKEMLLEERTLLAQHDARITKKRGTQRSKNAQLDAGEPDLNEVDDLTLKLMLERQAFRDRRQEEECTRPLKALLVDLGPIVHGGHRDEEVGIARLMSTFLRSYIHKQSDMVENLTKELDVIRVTFNRRVTYFAALQEISDSVAPPMFDNIERDLERADRQINYLEASLARATVRSRYLKFLDAEGPRDVHEECSICFGTSDDKYAMLLPCGHAYCVSCFREYRKSAHIGRKCAQCKTPINDRELTKIRIQNPDEDQATAAEGEPASQEDEAMGEDEETGEEDDVVAERERAARMADLNKLNMMLDSRQRDILALDMMGEYGSKINFLVKHILLSRLTKPGVRHVVFSNWADSLHIVESALRNNNIRFVSFASTSKANDVVDKFKNDPTITVFLLHGERESAGLTLTAAGVVHLLEPVLQHSFELQAIGRVDRLGQKNATEVYCYATMDTVETRILSQGVRNGTSIYLADEDAGERAIAAMPNVAQAARSGGDMALASADDEDLLKLIL